MAGVAQEPEIHGIGPRVAHAAEKRVLDGQAAEVVLGGLADVERDLIRTRPPKAAAGRRSAGSIWADRRN